jgi:hypothetical protein
MFPLAVKVKGPPEGRGFGLEIVLPRVGNPQRSAGSPSGCSVWGGVREARALDEAYNVEGTDPGLAVR